MTPDRFGDHGAGEVIHHVTAPCPLGVLLLAATERGICHAALGDDGDALLAELTERFARAEFRSGHAGLAGHVAHLLDVLHGKAALGPIALDIAATAFEARVWRALQAIPPGVTRTYGDIAAAIGAPQAARAVGRACGHNRVALIIPCHRAVAANGRLTGYRWGIERKRRLLALEATGRGVQLELC